MENDCRFRVGEKVAWLHRPRNRDSYEVVVVFVRYVGSKMAMVYKACDRTKEERRVPLRVLFSLEEKA